MPMTPVYDIQPPLELLKKGKAAEAIPMLEFISRQMPSHVSCHVLLAQAYAEEERWQEALSSWQNASFLMPNSPAIRKGFRDVLHILSRQTIKLIATAPEPEPEIEPSEDTEIRDALLDELIGGDSAMDVLENDLEASVESRRSTDIDFDELNAGEPEADPEESDTEESDTEEPDAEEPDTVESDLTAKELEPEEDAADETVTKPGYTPKNIFASKVPPPLAHLATDPESIAEDLELDELIHELETARIVPRPEHEIIEAPVLEADIDDMVSETLARIYEGQKQFGEAARVYEKLAAMQPDRASHFKQRATELRARAEGPDAV